MNKILIPTYILLILTGCSFINKNDKLNDRDIMFIEKQGLIDKSESIQVFSSSMTSKTSGNLVTNKRIAAYWIDNDKNESFKDFAFYENIMKIDSVDLTHAWTYASYLIITKKDSSSFKVYIDGDKTKLNTFYHVAMDNWNKKK